MIDYMALTEHLPVFLTVISILTLLIGVTYQLEKTFSHLEKNNNIE